VDEIKELFDLYQRLDIKKRTNRLKHYEPYSFQKYFHNARCDKGLPATQKALQAGNGIGKTWAGGFETAIHLTGRYPDWWEGVRFRTNITAMVGGLTHDTVRDILQLILCGDPADDAQLGTGTIPLECIGKCHRKSGIINAYDTVMVRNVNGRWSKVMFRAYEQGAKKHMGTRIHLGWCDEEPPSDIWSQYQRAAVSNKSLLMLTYTPEAGLTKVVDMFMNHRRPGQAIIRASWDDSPHMTDEIKEEKLAQLDPFERDMRSRGIPIIGSGLVFPIPEENIKVQPFDIPKHWPRICAIDFGWDHPFACVWIAWDRDNDTAYVYDAIRERHTLPPMHVAAINARGEWIPVVWPHDGLNTEKGSGQSLAHQYRELGANLRRDKFSNPPADGQKDGQGGNKVEPGIFEMFTRMNTGRFKVFANLTEWFDEFKSYHRKNGLIVDVDEDLMSATRYACLSLRHAITKPSEENILNYDFRNGVKYRSANPRARH